jgi:hypothetical protein
MFHANVTFVVMLAWSILVIIRVGTLWGFWFNIEAAIIILSEICKTLDHM